VHSATESAAPAVQVKPAIPLVLDHINTKVADWAKKKRLLVEDAEKAYLKVVEIQPIPPPRWFALAFRAAPLPREWTGSDLVPGGSGLTYEELRQEYLAIISVASEPMRRRARAAFQKCQNDAAKYQYTDELSKGCDAWLAGNPP
jgi:hypothetical protein